MGRAHQQDSVEYLYASLKQVRQLSKTLGDIGHVRLLVDDFSSLVISPRKELERIAKLLLTFCPHASTAEYVKAAADLSLLP